MRDKNYNQLCGIAFALDIVGERWTLLVIRELMAGPRRFKDLVAGLPDISTNLLTDRLKRLEQRGVIQRRTLPPPAGSTVYELTPVGLALEPALIEIGKWGSQFVPLLAEGATMLRPGSYALTLKTFFRPARAQGMDETWALHIDDEVLAVQVRDGRIQVQQGEPPHPNARFFMETPTLLGLLQRHLAPADALATGLVRAEGDPAALQRLITLCAMPTPDEAIVQT